MTGRWFTNSPNPKGDAADWMRWSVGSAVVIGPPRATTKSNMAAVIGLKMKGLYETKPGVPALPRAEDCPGYLP
jgi:hypothetical protein